MEHETGPQSAVFPFLLLTHSHSKQYRRQIYYLDLVMSVLIMYRRIIEVTKRHRCLSIRRV